MIIPKWSLSIIFFATMEPKTPKIPIIEKETPIWNEEAIKLTFKK